jgi:hypothetical protein
VVSSTEVHGTTAPLVTAAPANVYVLNPKESRVMSSLVFTDSKTAWESEVQNFQNVTSNYGTDATSFGTGMVSYPSGSVDTVGVTWNTWTGGYTGEVVDYSNSPSVIIHLSGLTAFGLEVEPFLLQIDTITVTLADGQTIADNVDGNGGAQFFGFAGGKVSSITISDSDPNDGMAFGNFYVSSTGIDYRLKVGTTRDAIALNAPEIATTFSFVGEYLGYTGPGGDTSYLTASKANHLIAAGEQILSIYQHSGMNTAAYWKGTAQAIRHKGLVDGETAYAAAIHDGQGQWHGSAIYFDIGIDPGHNAALLKNVQIYFRGVQQGFGHEASVLSRGVDRFTVGVYGAGITDSLIKDVTQLAAYAYLAGSQTWTGYKNYTDWDIKQVLDASTIKGLLSAINFSHVSHIASDEANGHYFGQWGSGVSNTALLVASNHDGLLLT